MALKLIVDKLEDIAEAQRDLYTLVDGKYHLAVDGLEDTAGLKKALKTERDARGEFEKRLKEFEGLDAKEAKELMSRFANDEELRLLKDGKVNELRDRWTEKMKKDFEKQLKESKDETVAEQAKSKRWESRVLDNAISSAVVGIVHDTALKNGDVLRAAREIFSADAEGNAVQVKEGVVVLGKDGHTPYGPSEWIETMRTSAPHWFPASPGGSGAQQSKQNPGKGVKTMKREAFDQLPAADKAAFSKDGVLVD